MATSSSSITTAPTNPWMRILEALEKKVNRHSYDTWLKPTRYSHTNGGIVFVRVPTDEFCHVGDKYADLIQEAMDDLQLGLTDVKFVAPDHDPAATPVRHDGGLSRSAATPISQGRFDWDGVAQLNPRYTFDAFVIGNGNQFACAAAQAVAENPSKAYNPLFLYGGVGMGKTHLMQAIGHEVKRRQPHAAICYLSSEKFTNEMINSLRYDKMSSFRDKFRNVDVLIIDDIQFLAQKERTQEEFFHTFNELYDHQKQIVISSDSQPKEIPGLVERLRSRFEWGLMVDMQPPDLETKMAILDKKAEIEGVRLPEDVRIFMATKTKSNVRELEGALVKLLAFSSLSGAPITMQMTQQVLKHLVHAQDRRVSIDSIQKAVAEHFVLKQSQLKEKSNTRAIAYPRQVAMYLVKELTQSSLPEIGRAFGGKHHTTVLHSIHKIEKLRQSDPDLNRSLHKLIDTLQ